MTESGQAQAAVMSPWYLPSPESGSYLSRVSGGFGSINFFFFFFNNFLTTFLNSILF